MAANHHTKILNAAGINDGLLRDHVVLELWRCVPQDIDEAIARREKQIDVLRDMKRDIVAENCQQGEKRQDWVKINAERSVAQRSQHGE